MFELLNVKKDKYRRHLNDPSGWAGEGGAGGAFVLLMLAVCVCVCKCHFFSIGADC